MTVFKMFESSRLDFCNFPKCPIIRDLSKKIDKNIIKNDWKLAKIFSDSKIRKKIIEPYYCISNEHQSGVAIID